MKSNASEPYDLIIAGAGPVGLLAALMAHKSGLKVLVLEKNSGPTRHSKSIGIHPPSLELIAAAGLLDAFLARGKMIRRGRACSHHGDMLGTLDFQSADTPFNYILTIPQWITESIFVDELNACNPGLLQWGATVTGLTEGELCEVQVSEAGASRSAGDAGSSGSNRVQGSAPTEMSNHGSEEDSNSVTTRVLHAKMVMGCDGKKSVIRQHAGIPFHGQPYASRYAMGDFADNTGYGSDAVIFLSQEGLVECFPLPDGIRRWVIQQDKSELVGNAGSFTEQVEKRCGIAPDPSDCSMFSQFQVERYLAGSLWQGRVVLAGDSAHVVSPIGGQGMNLGWINAALAIGLVASVLKGGQSLADAAQRYDRQARHRAMKVIRRAEFNMRLGNRNPMHRLRNKLVSMLLASPLRHPLRRRFTMQNL